MAGPVIDFLGLLGRTTTLVFVTNEQGDVVHANSALLRQFGFANLADLRSRGADLLQLPLELGSTPVRVVRCWEEGKRRSWYSILYVPLWDDGGRLSGTFGFLAPDSAPAPAPTPAFDLTLERLARARAEQVERWGTYQLPARSPEMLRVVSQLNLAASSSAPVTFLGEFATGKRSLAQSLHARGSGSRGKLALVLGDLPYEQKREILLGRFANEDPTRSAALGMLRAPGPGTLVLCDVGDLELDLQAEVAKAFSGPKPALWRLMATERRDLDKLLTENRLVPELYHLLMTFVISLPPLRRRTEELVEHIDHLLVELVNRGNKPVRIDSAAFAALRDYPWPGNLLELRTTLEQAIPRGQGTVELSHLPRRIRRGEAATVEPAVAISLDQTLETAERRLIVYALSQSGGNRSKAADLLQISRARFLRRLEQLGLESAPPALPEDAEST